MRCRKSKDDCLHLAKGEIRIGRHKSFWIFDNDGPKSVESFAKNGTIKITKGRVMSLFREEIKSALREWNLAWDNHDLEGVMKLFHEEALFENWTGGRALGKDAIRKAWTPWFANHGEFRFSEEETFIDEQEQKVLFRWQLEWPSAERGFEGKPEKRRGVDVLHFQNGKIIKKLTYTKTTIEIGQERFPLRVSKT